MTCIAGVVQDGVVYIGADSALTTGTLIRILKKPKVFRNGPFVMGCTTSSFRVHQLLEYALEVPEQEEGMPDEKYIVQVFVEAVSECFKEHGFGKNNKEFGTLLVGYRGALYQVYSGLTAVQYFDGVAACGRGGEFALGVMYDLQGLGAEERISRALAAAAYFEASVLPPFGVMKTS